MGYKKLYCIGNSSDSSDIYKSIYLTVVGLFTNEHSAVVMCDENTAKDLPTIRPKNLPYCSLPIMCNVQKLVDFLSQKGHLVAINGSISDSDTILFFNPDDRHDFIISPRSAVDFNTLINLNPEYTIYIPEQLILD